MRTKAQLYKVAREFFNTDNIVDIKEIPGGHINSTYLVSFQHCHYLLQQINDYVFYSPISVMNNIGLITEHIEKRCTYEGRNIYETVLRFIKTRYGQIIAIVDGEYWRCMDFIENGRTYDVITSDEMFEENGRAVGDFQFLMSDFHTRLLDDTIKHFHDTPYRYKKFIDMIKIFTNGNDEEVSDRINECKNEIKFIKARSKDMNYITSRIEDKILPRRVCHNDTKSSNIMIDDKTGKFMCMIDLDTCMKGSLLYDYGDALRMGASTASEDEVDLNKVGISLSRIRAFTKGFLYSLRPRGGKEYITDNEIDSLYYGYYTITLELGLRFLEDYILGDKYFKINKKRPKHNLERARNQLKLVKEIEDNKENIEQIILECKKEAGF